MGCGISTSEAQGNVSKKHCESDHESDNDLTADVIEPQHDHPFTCVPATPSRVDPAILREANTALLDNIQSGIFDSPTHAFIPKLATFAEFSATQLVIANHENQAKETIIKRRREVMTGKRVVLKDNYIVSTEEIYEKLNGCEKATYEKKSSKGRGHGKRASAGPVAIITNVEESGQTRNDVIEGED